MKAKMTRAILDMAKGVISSSLIESAKEELDELEEKSELYELYKD